MSNGNKHAQNFLPRLERLSKSQLSAIESILNQFERPYDFVANPQSDLISECILREFGDILRVHHCFSAEAFTKDKFEYALERVFNSCGKKARRAPRGNRGHDITIDGVPFSLKTQADSSIKADFIHISKFMELGKGKWGDDPKDLIGLRDNFLEHMHSYKRILTLRCFRKRPDHDYELIEIPKKLLQEAKDGHFKMMVGSKQFPKPGTCTVLGKDGSVSFELYFDGGTERKLQIKKIRKDLCVQHASWTFARDAKETGGNTLWAVHPESA